MSVTDVKPDVFSTVLKTGNRLFIICVTLTVHNGSEHFFNSDVGFQMICINS